MKICIYANLHAIDTEYYGFKRICYLGFTRHSLPCAGNLLQYIQTVYLLQYIQADIYWIKWIISNFVLKAVSLQIWKSWKITIMPCLIEEHLNTGRQGHCNVVCGT